MTAVLRRRAEIALNSLDLKEQARVRQSLDLLGKTDFGQLVSSGKVSRLAAPANGLYSFRATPRLRLLLSRREDVYMVEDILSRDRYSRLVHEARS